MYLPAIFQFCQEDYEVHRFDPSLVAKYMCKYCWLRTTYNNISFNEPLITAALQSSVTYIKHL